MALSWPGSSIRNRDGNAGGSAKAPLNAARRARRAFATWAVYSSLTSAPGTSINPRLFT